MLGHIGGRATEFAPHRQPLQQAQGHQQRRREQSDLGIGGQQADGHGGKAHQHDGDQEGAAAADPIADAAEHQRTERAHHPAGAEHRQRREQTGGLVAGRKEQTPEHHRQRAVKEEVEPLEHGAGHRRGDRAYR